MAHHGHNAPREDCPICCEERLSGALSPDPSIAGRALAALAAGLLAVAAGTPVQSVAQEPDQVQEGIVAPEETLGADQEDTGFDPGGDTALPFEVGPPPASPNDTSPDGGPIETEPEDDREARLAPLDDPEPIGTGPTPVEPPSDAPSAPVNGEPPAPPPEPGFAIEPLPPEPVAPSERAGAEELGVEEGGELDEKASPPNVYLERTAGTPPGERRTGRPAGAETTKAVTAQAVAAQAAQAAGSAEAEVPEEAPAPARGPASARVHVVQPGESLWTIAQSSLGPDASAVRVAREVARLWMLNDDRIATGDPDMIMVGTRLRLR